MNKKTKFLHTPPGSKPFYKEEALFRNKIEKTFSNFFENWGFFPIETPIIDYFDVYSPILSEELKKGSIRFVDRDGEIILLRNDITLFAAKLVASRISENKNMLKYFYSDAIIRCEKNGAPEEYHQIGCEIVADNFTYQEIEIFCILLESLNLVKINNFKLHIGDISFYQKLLTGISEQEFNSILLAIRLRDSNKLTEILSNCKISEELKNDCLLASKFIGNLDELQKLDFSEKAKKSINKLFELGKTLNSLGYEENILIDLSELSNLSYYNGIIFHVYAKGVETPLVSGGRYDLLFKELGIKKNAIGFIYWLNPLEKLLNNDNFFNEKVSEKIKIKDEPQDSFKKAIDFIKQGKKVIIEY